MKKNINSISGDPASGNGAVSEILKEELNYVLYKNGEYFRKLAKEKNMTLEEFGDYVEKHPEIDQQIEESAKEYAKDHDNFIIDARLGFYVVPESFKIYLTVDLDEAAKRAFLDKNRKDVESYNSVEEYKKAFKTRIESENEIYLKLYNVKKDDLKNYDLVVDTTDKTPNEVVDIVMKNYENWLNN